MSHVEKKISSNGSCTKLILYTYYIISDAYQQQKVLQQKFVFLSANFL